MQDIGEKGEQLMKNKIKYTDEPMDFEVIEDFLPPPTDFVFRRDCKSNNQSQQVKCKVLQNKSAGSWGSLSKNDP